jgi:transcriptional pleiotropic repressor
MDLLSKTRRISRILQRNVSHHLVDFDQVAEALCDVIGANIYVVSPEGEILGLAINHEIENERMQKYLKERQFPEEYATLLMEVDKTSSNVSVDSPYTAYPVEMKDMFKHGYTT